MEKAEQVAINHKKLTSAIFHLQAAYKQIGDTYNTTMLYNTIEKTLISAKERLAKNETAT